MNSSESKLPTFKYHPDPVSTGNIVASDTVCLACERARGYVYAGRPFSGEEDLDGLICPWCIADGSAAKRFDAHFTIVNKRKTPDVDPGIIDELLHRTPGFTSWQDFSWLFHCRDGCEFRGDLPANRIGTLSQADRASIMSELPINWTWEWIAESYEPGGQPGIYWFVCRHCGVSVYHADHT